MTATTKLHTTLAILISVLGIANASPSHAQRPPTSGIPNKSLAIVAKSADVGRANPAVGAKSVGTGWLELGQPVAGDLSPGDDVLGDGSFADYWYFEVLRAGYIVIEMVSSSVDAYLILHTADQEPLASDDDGGDDVNALLVQYLEAGSYQVIANSYGPGETGRYVLSVRSEG